MTYQESSTSKRGSVSECIQSGDIVVSMVTDCQLTQYEYGISETDLLSQLNTVTISRREVELVGVSLCDHAHIVCVIEIERN